MVDIFHQWGSDLTVGPTGDLATATPPILGQQRVLRRLLTNTGDYIWQPLYGAGLAQFIGGPTNPLQVRANVRGQIFKEAAVARDPEPIIDILNPPDGAIGSVFLNIRYTDSQNGQTQVLAVEVGA
jgi:phage baseplate assembly protein W